MVNNNKQDLLTQKSIILDPELLDENQRQELKDLGYNSDVCFYGSGYDVCPMICWSRSVDNNIDLYD